MAHGRGAKYGDSGFAWGCMGGRISPLSQYQLASKLLVQEALKIGFAIQKALSLCIDPVGEA